MSEILKPKVGDIVTVRGKVEDEGNDGFWVSFKPQGFCWLKPESIVSIEPRPLAVGDKVRWRDCPYDEFIIRAIDDGIAWLKYKDVRFNGPLSDLEHVE